MTWQITLLAFLIIIWALAQYGLAFYALRDLHRRPRVRGNNKVLWGLVILAVPIAGALIYSVYGPTSFIRRGVPRPVPRLAPATATRSRPGATRVPSSHPRPRPNDPTPAPDRTRRPRPIQPPDADPTPREESIVADGSGRH